MEHVILQPGGIGDILFCQKIAYKIFLQKGIICTWPISKEIFWISEYINAPINFVKLENSIYEKYLNINEPQISIIDGRIIIPLHIADRLFPTDPVMESKYKMVNLSYQNWSNYINIVRNYKKEIELFNLLTQNLNKDSYTIANRTYATPPSHACSLFMNDITADIEHTLLPKYNVFDWILTYEKSKIIHTVSTCTFYIFESLNVEFPKINIYNRRSELDLHQLEFLRSNLKHSWCFKK